MRKRSRSKLSLDSNDTLVPHPYPLTNASQISMPDSASFYRSYSPTGSLSQPSLKKESRMRKLRMTKLSSPPSESPGEVPFTLDTNFSDMDGIIRSDALAGSSTASTSNVSENTSSGALLPSLFSSSMFSDPFSPTSLSSKRRAHYFHDFRKISPKTIPSLHHNGQTQHSSLDKWTPPESWVVEKDDDALMADVHSTSEDECIVVSSLPTPGGRSTPNDTSARKRRDHKPHHPSKQAPSATNKLVRVRIYRDDGSYHVAQLLQTSTVADLTPSLNAKLLLDQERETHRLYLKERGRG